MKGNLVEATMCYFFISLYLLFFFFKFVLAFEKVGGRQAVDALTKVGFQTNSLWTSNCQRKFLVHFEIISRIHFIAPCISIVLKFC
jgi:hypothetical protein